VIGEALQAGGGGRVHVGGYEIDGRAGWTPVCGDASARRWFRVGLDVNCPACLRQPRPWTMAMLLDTVDDIADELERAGTGAEEGDSMFGPADRAVARLRALRGDSTGETDPVARMQAVARIYGTEGKT
jgi:hypothetical protein